MGALFFDADRDGDLDLFVGSGSNEWAPGDIRYTDRLYLNTSQIGGPLEFTAAPPTTLPVARTSTSCVVGADFDRDGDVDLFVGARSVPGQYLVTPKSRLLRNDGQQPHELKFTDITDSVAPGLADVGLVTGALWSDADDDGSLDLIVACEWGPVHLFCNRQGSLFESTEPSGLAAKQGWWNGVVGSDLDADGDIDYAVMNVGLNTKYGRPTAEKQVFLYRNDMDQNGVTDLVEAKASNAGELPVRGRSCSCNAMPALRAKFPTYKKFATADLLGIYEDKLDTAIKAAANELESGVWINHSKPGQPKFTWKSLPYDAQVSPCYGAVATDLYTAEKPNLALLQNLYTREPETGPWRGGLGCIFASSIGTGDFASVAPSNSGFIVDGDGKALASADLNSDGLPDLIATQNDDHLLAFLQVQPEGRIGSSVGRATSRSSRQPHRNWSANPVDVRRKTRSPPPRYTAAPVTSHNLHPPSFSPCPGSPMAICSSTSVGQTDMKARRQSIRIQEPS